VTLHPTPAAISPGRMEPLARLPVFLALEGKRAVLAGGNAAAAWKAELLSAAGARVDVYAEGISEELRALVAAPPRGLITLHERCWTEDDITGAALAVGAFGCEADAAVFANAARAAGVPVNIIDKPAFCDFAFGAIVNRSPLVIGISTDGAAPVFAQAIRTKLETLLPKSFAVWAAAAQSWRAAVKTSGLTLAARRKFWQLFAVRVVTQAERDPGPADFESLMMEVKADGAAADNGSVTLINVAAADPELLTLRAVRALQSADIILFDDFVSGALLDFARREARKLLVGKTSFGPAGDEDDINALMMGLARQGRRVVRLKGGDQCRPASDVEDRGSAGAASTASADHGGAAA
jgi:uroporphyrin-III C-methyltransferase / precorrin-2 dehydrogenase / sirohydrochlorin ferrochelatase